MVYVAKVRILGRDVMSSEQVIQLDVLTRSLKNVCKDCRGCFILLAPPVMSLGSGALEEMSTAQQFSVTSDFCTLSALEPSSAFTSSLEANTLVPNATVVFHHRASSGPVGVT